MREIKFRAWDKEKGEFFSPTYEAYKGDLEDLHLSLDGRLGLRTVGEYQDESLFPERFVLQQFTGILDKNGKEIFEGDVIFAGRYDSATGAKYVATISYDDTNRLRSAHKWYVGGYSLTAYKNSVSDFDNEEKWEVIGNIYENPELLTNTTTS